MKHRALDQTKNQSLDAYNELHITRADSWLESESAAITLEEWRNYIASDPQMRMERFAEADVTDGSRLR